MRDRGRVLFAFVLLLIILFQAIGEENQSNDIFPAFVCGWIIIIAISLFVIALPVSILSRRAKEARKRAEEAQYQEWLRGKNQIDALTKLHPTEFEYRIVQLFKDLHYQVEHRGKTGDGGVDLTVRSRDGTLWVVQCKKYATGKKVGQPEIRDLFGTMYHEHANKAALITTSDFTPKAREFAREKPISLINGERLVRLIQKASQPR